MRIAAFGGPYSNPYALRALLADAPARGCERIFCLGDLGGFGAEPDALWPLLRDAGVECIAGNYDVAIGRGDTDCGCGYRDPRDNEYAQIAYDYTLAHTSPEFAAWMRTLPTERRETIEGVEVHLVHGSPVGLNDFFWESLDEDELRARVGASGAGLILCTHSGLPWQRRLDASTPAGAAGPSGAQRRPLSEAPRGPASAAKDVDGTLVVNVGVLGRPANDGRHEVWYAVLDLEAGEARAELVPLAYDWRAHAASMRAAGLPQAFTETIETGWWTTCLQILPPAERARGRFHVYRSELGPDLVSDGLGPRPGDDPDRPVVPLFGTALFPRRLWVDGDPPAGVGEVGFVEIRPLDRPVSELSVSSAGWCWGSTAVAGPGTAPADVVRLVTERILATARFPGAVSCA